RLEIAEVLLREDRRRAEDGDLAPRHGDAKGGAQRDLGLAEADVATDEAVHRAVAVEILEDLLDGLGLVGRLVEGEARLELRVGAVHGRDGLASGGAALGVELDELLGHLLDGLVDRALLLREGGAAEPVELRLVAVLA